MKLKTIKEHNDAALAALKTKANTGIACPECEMELQYENKNVFLTTCPPQRYVICVNCAYRTSVLA